MVEQEYKPRRFPAGLIILAVATDKMWPEYRKQKPAPWWRISKMLALGLSGLSSPLIWLLIGLSEIQPCANTHGIRADSICLLTQAIGQAGDISASTMTAGFALLSGFLGLLFLWLAWSMTRTRWELQRAAHSKV